MNGNVTVGTVSAIGRDARALAPGGGIAPQRELHANSSDLLKLEVGMSEDAVHSILGEPGRIEAWALLGGEPVSIWFYETQSRRAGHNATRDELIPVLFRSGRLAGWDSESFELKVVYPIRLM